MFPLRYVPGAAEDLFAAVRYYESRSAGLGGEFLDEVEEVFAEIREHPKRPPLIMRRIRKRNTRRFPYGIIYTVLRGAVFIIAIGDLRRHPKWWKYRLRYLRRQSE
jgi:toxin ParE1/3/4